MSRKTKKRNFFEHLHSPLVNRKTLHPLTTFGLGVAALTCLAVLLITGLTLFLYYVPDQRRAYERILHITTTLRYGGLVRNLHFVAANALIIVAFLHLIRVFLTGSYKRRFLNWSYGLGILVLILLANFTGYLLPWDQTSYWAAKVGSNLASYFPLIGPEIKRFLLGGQEIGHETLIRAFALHAGTIPPLIVALVFLHMWRIRKDGGLAGSAGATRERLPASPWLYQAGGAAALLTLSVLLILALFVHAPIAERADAFHPPNPAKAPWYFVGFQEMVSHSAFLGGVVAPTLMGLFLFFVPLLDRSASPGGKWFARDRRLLNLILVVILLCQLVFIVVGYWFRGMNWQFQTPF